MFSVKIAKTYIAIVLGVFLLSFCLLAGAWEYREQVDRMREEKTRTASVISSNKVNFDFPYNGGSRLVMTVRERPQDGLNILLRINKGLFSCFDDCDFRAKFDNDEIVTVRATGSSDGSSDVIFIQSKEEDFLEKLKGAKRLIIEADFYDHGSEQFSFNVKGLKW